MFGPNCSFNRAGIGSGMHNHASKYSESSDQTSLRDLIEKTLRSFTTVFSIRSCYQLYLLRGRSEHLRTSVQEFFTPTNAAFVDALNTFPYYPMPEDAAVWLTSFGRQLGNQSQLHVLGIDYSKTQGMLPDEFLSAHDLQNCALDQRSEASLCTQLESVLNVLDNFDLAQHVRKIEYNSNRLKEVLRDAVLGHCPSPVVHVDKHRIPLSIASKYSLAGLYDGSENYRIYTYSEPQREFESFFDELEIHLNDTPQEKSIIWW